MKVFLICTLFLTAVSFADGIDFDSMTGIYKGTLKKGLKKSKESWGVFSQVSFKSKRFWPLTDEYDVYVFSPGRTEETIRHFLKDKGRYPYFRNFAFKQGAFLEKKSTLEQFFCAKASFTKSAYPWVYETNGSNSLDLVDIAKVCQLIQSKVMSGKIHPQDSAKVSYEFQEAKSEIFHRYFERTMPFGIPYVEKYSLKKIEEI